MVYVANSGLLCNNYQPRIGVPEPKATNLCSLQLSIRRTGDGKGREGRWLIWKADCWNEKKLIEFFSVFLKYCRMNFVFQNVKTSWMWDWAESVLPNRVCLRESLGVSLTSFTHPVKTALSSPRYGLPQCVLPASELWSCWPSRASLNAYVSLQMGKGALPEKDAPGFWGLRKGIGHLIFCRVLAGGMQLLMLILKPEGMEVPLVWIKSEDNESFSVGRKDRSSDDMMSCV